VLGRVGEDASAVLRWRGGEAALVVGFPDGNVRALPRKAARLRPGAARRDTYLEETPPSAATHLLEGPGGLLFAGFAGGEVGIWDLATGSRLHLEALHGMIRFLVLRGRKLYAATDLGDYLVWDLRPLYLSSAELLAEVRRRVPVVWREGRAVLAGPR